MGVILGSSMLAIGVYLTGTLFGSLNTTNDPAFYDAFNAGQVTNASSPFYNIYNVTGSGQVAFSDIQTKTFTAYKILSIALIVGAFMVIIGTLISIAFF